MGKSCKDMINGIYGKPNGTPYGQHNLELETWYLYVRYWYGLAVYECRTANIYYAVGLLYCKSIEKIERVDYTQNRPSVDARPFPYSLSL